MVAPYGAEATRSKGPRRDMDGSASGMTLDHAMYLSGAGI